MLIKDKVKKSLEEMPDEFLIDELLERLFLIEKIDRGIKDSEENKVISTPELNLMVEEWSS